MHITSLGRRAETLELLDGPLQPDADLAGNLDDLAAINRWSGGNRLLHAALHRLIEQSSGRWLSLLDVGGGDGSGLAGVVWWAARRRLQSRGILLDRSEPILQLARRRRQPPFWLLQGDACRLPLADNSVDVVMCSLVLHHFAPAPARRLLREMARVARHGIVVDDLLRSHVGLFGAWAMTRLLTSNRLTRHDAPLSVRRAYRSTELATLLDAAMLQPIWWRTIPGYRTVVAARTLGESSP